MNEYEYKYEDKCWFNGSCYIQKTKGCNRFCALRREFDYLLFASEVPEKFKSYDKLVLHPEDEDVETFITLNDIKSDIDTFVDEGRFLYIWGKTAGSGKSSWSIKIMLTYLAMKSLGNGFNPNVAFFVYVPNFLFKAKNFENKEERQEVLDKALNVDLLILDDLSATQVSNYDSSVLSDVIDARYRENKATIYTSNLSPSELSVSCGERTADRVLSDIVLEIKGAGHRESTNTYRRKNVK